MESLWKGQDCVSLVLNKPADINRLDVCFRFFTFEVKSQSSRVGMRGLSWRIEDACVCVRVCVCDAHPSSHQEQAKHNP